MRDLAPVRPYWGLRDYGADGQIGLEATPDEYVAAMVSVFAGVRRVLRDDGTLWLNLGDSYATNGTMTTGRNDADRETPGGRGGSFRGGDRSTTSARADVKPKDLVGIPWRVAFALQTDGWYLRSAIVWSKPNPMPESVTDRPTSAYEMIFLLAKSARYYYDADAIREDDAGVASGNGFRGRQGTASYHARSGGEWRDEKHVPGGGRNARNVWTIPTQPFPEAHFATYPEELPRRCILAGSRERDTVLDPFIGSGTTAKVARDHGRNAIGIDLNTDYLTIAAKRLRQLSLLAGAADQ